MLRNRLLAGAIAVLAAGAAVHATLDRGQPGADGPAVERDDAPLEGPDVPAARVLPGSLVFADADCRLHELDLVAVSLAERGEGEGCTRWLSPSGAAAVATRSEPGDSAAWLVRLVPESEPIRRLGTGIDDVTWSASGDRLAYCDRGETTVVVATDDGRELERVRGCEPRFGSRGALLTSIDRPGRAELLIGGRATLVDGDLRAGFPPATGAIRALGYDERSDGLLAVAVVSAGGPEPTARQPVVGASSGAGPFGSVALQVSEYRRFVLQLWRDGTLEETVQLRGLAYPFVNLDLGEVVRFSPRGDELAIGARGHGVPVMLVDVETLTLRLPPTVQQGFAWSPDGAWFALADAFGVRIAGAVRDRPAYVLPVSARSLVWR